MQQSSANMFEKARVFREFLKYTGLNKARVLYYTSSIPRPQKTRPYGGVYIRTEGTFLSRIPLTSHKKRNSLR